VERQFFRAGLTSHSTNLKPLEPVCWSYSQVYRACIGHEIKPSG
jgi:hypothetical protein